MWLRQAYIRKIDYKRLLHHTRCKTAYTRLEVRESLCTTGNIRRKQSTRVHVGATWWIYLNPKTLTELIKTLPTTYPRTIHFGNQCKGVDIIERVEKNESDVRYGKM